MKARVLYISYDGMTDNLGRSQVIPYLQGLAAEGYEITLLSCEKKERYNSFGKDTLALLRASGINWEHTWYSNKVPVVSKVLDQRALNEKALELASRQRYDIVHCRSYVAAISGLKVKKASGARFLFDMRGFWVDERVEGGLWNRGNPLWNAIYKKFKRIESSLLDNADAIVVLTFSAEEILRDRKETLKKHISVIPCAADLDFFSVTSKDQLSDARSVLNIRKEVFVLGYLGSLGTWYRIEEMMQYFALVRKKYSEAVFLLLTPDDPEIIYAAAEKSAVPKNSLRIHAAVREKVPSLFKAADAGIFFINPSFSKKGSSPTKLGEMLAMGIPVICNSGIGDVDYIINDCKAGIVLPDMSVRSMEASLEKLPVLMELNPALIRQRALPYIDLRIAVEAYSNVYKKLVGRVG